MCNKSFLKFFTCIITCCLVLFYTFDAKCFWHIETVDSEGNVGINSSLALDSGGNPHISYYDVTNTALKYAYYDGSWHQVSSSSTVRGSRLRFAKGETPSIRYEYMECGEDVIQPEMD